MSKIDRILSLLSLLSHRRSISINTVKTALGIPRRTAFRYLNTLSEANIPLIYDKGAGGYRLVRTPDVALPAFSDNDIVLLVTVLMFARRHLNLNYKSSVDSIIDNLCVRQRLPLEHVVMSLRNAAPKHVVSPDYSAEITATILQLAVAESRDLEVIRVGRSREQKTVTVRNPSLTFRRSWRLTGQGAVRKEEIDMASILLATLCRGSDKSPD